MRSSHIRFLALLAVFLLFAACKGEDMQRISDGDESERETVDGDLHGDGDMDSAESDNDYSSDGDAEIILEDAGEIEPEPEAEDGDGPESFEAPEDEEIEVDEGPVALSVSGVYPSFGIYNFSTGVNIEGRGFSEDAAVYVGDVAATQVGFLSDSELYAVFPGVALENIGPRNVRVVQGTEEYTLERAFAYLYSEDPVVMVHGWSGSPAEMQWIHDNLLQAGYPAGYLNRIAYSNNMGSNLVNAAELAAFIDEVLLRTGASKVDIVAHSMGGLSSRLYIRNSGGVHVRDYVSTCGAHHGTSETCLAMGLAGEGGKEMCPAYAEENNSYNNVQFLLNGDPDVEDVDETPFGAEDGGWIYYNAIYSNIDGVIVPHTSSCLNQKSSGDCTDAINHQVSHFHNSALSAPDVIAMVEQFIRRHKPSDDF